MLLRHGVVDEDMLKKGVWLRASVVEKRAWFSEGGTERADGVESLSVERSWCVDSW
jgi:hypothetical protein